MLTAPLWRSWQGHKQNQVLWIIIRSRKQASMCVLVPETSILCVAASKALGQRELEGALQNRGWSSLTLPSGAATGKAKG